jgi:hypothetical protein
MKDIPCKIKCKNSICAYISVASETGIVALSFLQMDEFGETIENGLWLHGYKFRNENKNKVNQDEDWKEGTLDRDYITCRIYRENQDDILEMPFQGRAAFTRDGLVLIGQWTLDIYDAKSLNRMYSFKPGNFYLNSYIVGSSDRKCYQDQKWNREYLLQDGACGSSTEGSGLAIMSAHIRKGVIAVYDQSFTSYQTRSVKIWSILTGSLVCSFAINYGKHVVFVSKDHRFLVAQGIFDESLNIYCMKSGTRLHTYTPQGIEDISDECTIVLVELMENSDYMLIMGIISRQNGNPHESRHYFFEIFSVSQKRTIKYVEKNIRISPKALFVVDILQTNYFPNPESSKSPVYFPSQFFGVFLEKTSGVNQIVNFKNIPLINPESNGLKEEKLWGEFVCKWKRNGKWKDNELCIFDHRLDCDKNMVLYLLEKGTHKFILRFSSHTMQLWKLEPAGEEEEEPFNFGDEESNSNKNQEKSNYFGDVANNTLIFTRAYYDPAYKMPSKSVNDLKFISGRERESYRPYIHFTEDEGRILVYATLKNGSRIVDEILLPMQELKSTASFCQDVSKVQNYNIESYLLALIHRCRSSQMTEVMDSGMLV